MGGVLRVDPERLRNAARAQADVGGFISDLGAAQSMSTAGAGVAGLLSEGACQFAGATVENALGAVRRELIEHSAGLSTAADHYSRSDNELGRRLRKFVP